MNVQKEKVFFVFVIISALPVANKRKPLRLICKYGLAQMIIYKTSFPKPCIASMHVEITELAWVDLEQNRYYNQHYSLALKKAQEKKKKQQQK